MKQITKSRFSAIILALLFCGLKAFALDYAITFTGSGASSTVENVIVQNLTKGTQTTVPGGSVLHLSDQTNGVEKPISDTETMKIVPTPEEGKYNMSFYSPNTGVTQISTYSLDGRKLAGINTNLQIGENSFQLSLPQGLYVVRVAGNGYSYSEKLVNQVGVGVNPGIAYAGVGHAENQASQKSKGVASVFMSYTTGDMLLYKGVSGNYSTIVTDVPTASKTTNFNFVECKDASGNYYTIVKIGNQTWMAENLRTTKYRTGDDIVNLTNNSDWGLFTISSWCNYNNDAANGAIYGKLYNWYAVADSRNVAPIGWHVATDDDWTTLTTCLGGTSVAGGKLKEIGTLHWGAPNTSATNETGFTALPGGNRGNNNGTFDIIGVGTFWWTATAQTDVYAYFRSIGNTSAGVGKSGSQKMNGLSVRCVKDADLPTVTTAAPTSITYTTAIGGGNITSDGGASILDRGICWSTTANPTIANSKSSAGTGTGAFTATIMGLTVNTTYYVRAYATNSSGTAYGQQHVFNSKPYDATVADVDGNIYHTITIGNQTWMVENLKTTKYRNGDLITNVTSNSGWISSDSGAYCWYNNDTNNKNNYGAMYNGYAVQESRNIAPVGWHVPTDAEWAVLENYLITNGYNYDKTTTENKLAKSLSSTILWQTSSTVGSPGYDLAKNNTSGLSMVPAGYRSGWDGNYYVIGTWSGLWTLTAYSTTSLITRYFGQGSICSYIGNSSKNTGLPVRCIKNAVPIISSTAPASIISTSATCGGNVTTDGGETVTEYGVCWSTSSNPTIANSKKSVSSGIGSFTTSISGLTPNTTYYVRAYATNSLGTAYGQEVSFKTLLTDPVTVTDIDGNIYHTVTIGNQTWMVENLKTTRYNDGSTITYVPYAYDWPYATNGGYCWANGSIANKELYGAMYNWYAVSTGKLAPTGWHVPTKNEVETLVAYLGGTNAAGSKLKETGNSHWISGNSDATNSSGFTALPGGYRSNATGDYQQFGVTGVWWSTTEFSGTVGYHLGLESANTLAVINTNNKLLGCNVRCLKNTIPTVSTGSISSIMSTTISALGNVVSDGGETVTEKGLCWSTSSNPTVADPKAVVGSGIGSFSTIVTGLTPNTTYYVRAYATNSLGIAYGQEMSFKTLLTDPVTVTDIDGNVYNTVTIGTQTWMVENLKTTRYRNGDVIGTTSMLNIDLTYSAAPKYQWAYNGLESNVSTYGRLYTWHAVADSRNLAPIGFHVPNDVEWSIMENYLIANGYNYDKTTTGNKMAKSVCATTLWNTTSIVGSPGCDMTQNNASGLSIYPAGYRGYDGYFYNFGLATNIWTLSETSSSHAVMRQFQNTLVLPANLSLNKNYGFSVRCIKNSIPILNTNNPSAILSTTVSCGGTVTADGGETVTEHGVCWSTSSNPTVANSTKSVGTGNGTFSTSISGLTPNTTYYVRAYATNALGTAYGEPVTFKTLLTDPVTLTDADGNVYHTVTIGTQTWMVENLKTTKYNDGTAIPYISNSYDWTITTAGGYCWPNGSISNKEVYGAMYNWYAASTGKLAPLGWHVPTKADFETLLAYLGGDAVAGSKLKEIGTLHWNSDSSDATNSSGFTGLPAGYRSCWTGDYTAQGSLGVFWSSTEVTGNGGRFIMSNNATNAGFASDQKRIGFSVRCIKD